MKRLRINKDQMERGQGQDKQKKVVNRMSSNEEEIQVTLMTVRPGETGEKAFLSQRFCFCYISCFWDI